MILALGYNYQTETLVAQFDIESFYIYEGVPPLTACRVIFAESVGKEFNALIKADHKYGFRKITAEEAEAV